MGCGPCANTLPCADHPDETPCAHCSYSRRLHDFRHDYPLNNGICKTFKPIV